MINVTIAGLPGKMATLVAQAILKQGDMYPSCAFLGETCVDIGQLGLPTIPMEKHEEHLLKNREHIDLIVDFTQPTSANRNAEMYCRVGIPFVMGTTGGDRDKLAETVRTSNISAVIATNMAIPVVIFQEMIKFAGQNFAGALNGFKLVIRESHQASKPDPSGTAVSLLPSFAALGLPLDKENIKMLRDPHFQHLALDVPEKYLDGHGYHTYAIESQDPDHTVKLEFSHNVLGRNVYVDGALRAIRFLAKMNPAGCDPMKGHVFSMIDVLKQGGIVN